MDRWSGKSFYAFDGKGHFIKKVLKGKGPGEVISPYAFTIDETNSCILLEDQITASLYRYDLGLHFINTMKHKYITITDFYPVSRDSMLVYDHVLISYPKQNKKYSNYYLYFNNFDTVKCLGVNLEGFKSCYNLQRPICHYENYILFVAPWNYNIYQLKNGNVNIKYQLDFGKYNFSPEELVNLSSDRMDEYTNDGKRIGLFNSLFRTKDFITLVAEYQEKPLTFFIDAKSKETFCFNDCIKAGLIPDCQIWGTKPDGSYYGLIEPENLIAFQKVSGKFNEIEVHLEDNPYIINFSVKKP